MGGIMAGIILEGGKPPIGCGCPGLPPGGGGGLNAPRGSTGLHSMLDVETQASTG